MFCDDNSILTEICTSQNWNSIVSFTCLITMNKDARHPGDWLWEWIRTRKAFWLSIRKLSVDQ